MTWNRSKEQKEHNLKPYKTYDSLFKRKKKLLFLLSFLAFFQLLVILLGTVRIPVPETLANQLLQFNESTTRIAYKNCRLNLPNLLEFKDVKVFSHNRKVFSSESLKITFHLLPKRKGILERIHNIRLRETKFFDSSEYANKVSFREINLHNYEALEIFFSSRVMIGDMSLNLAGTINREFINETARNLASKPTSRTEKLEQVIEQIITYTGEIHPTQLNCLASISKDSKFSFYQPKRVQGFSQNRKIATDQLNGYALSSVRDSTLEITELKMHCTHLLISMDSQVIEINDVAVLAANKNLDKTSFKTPFSDLFFTVNQSTLKNNINGSLPPFSFRFKLGEKASKMIFFTDSNSSSASIESVINEEGNSLNGFLHLIPKNFNLLRSHPTSPVKMLDGEKVSLTFNNNFIDPIDPNANHFHLIGKTLSVLGSPFGNFDLSGKLLNDFSIEIGTIHGLLGKSEVRGSYVQKWNPHQFRFLVKGTCFPQDVNNWFKEWWDRIWPDFQFSQSIPYGDFSISGEWGGNPVHSFTYGKVWAKDFHYREMPIQSAEIEVQVNDQATSIKSDQIIHHLGSLSGNLNFPRAHQASPYLLNFSMDGELPFNDCRKVFGPTVEKQLTNIDASLINIRGYGEIAKNENSASAENPTNYNLSLASRLPVSFHGISSKEIKGEIDYIRGITKGSFAEIKIAEGKCSLNFKKTDLGQSSLFDFSLELKDANRKALINELKHISNLAQNAPVIFEDSNDSSDQAVGKMDLSLQAKGPIEDYLQFVGTGMIGIREKGLGQINLLGNLSRELSDFRLPIPSGAFTFDTLTSPFRVEHESVFFDKMMISGPLSILESKGNFNLDNGNLDFLARLKLIGNLPIPVIKQIIGFADPLSKIAEIKITGTIDEPKWKLEVNPTP